MVAWATYVGGTKPETPAAARVAQLVMALRGGGIVDPSGVLGTATQIAAIEMFNEETAAILAAASNIVTAALADYAVLTNRLATNNYSVAYIGYDFLRADPPNTTNHNIVATIQRTSQSGTTNRLSAWVYFSEVPATNVNIYLQASVAEGAWTTLVPVTNTWPAFEDVGGLPCYRYCYEIPAGMRGVPFKPLIDIQFGGYEPGQYLNISADGVVVETNGVSLTPYTGWDYSHPEPWGTNLAIRYVGGIAVEAVVRGTNYTGIAGEVGL
jgi:hypothetical protein